MIAERLVVTDRSAHHFRCSLVRGSEQAFSWLPSGFSSKGKLVCLRRAGRWELGWMVTEAFESAPSALVLKNDQEYRLILVDRRVEIGL